MNLRQAARKAYDACLFDESGIPIHYFGDHDDPNKFGIAITPVINSENVEVGNSGSLFTIQSISKVFNLLQAMELFGLEKVYERVGVEPSGELFNSVDLMPDGRAYNPFINAGAITIVGMLYDKYGIDTKDYIASFISEMCGENLYIDNRVFQLEESFSARNLAITYLLVHNKYISHVPDDVVEAYNCGCSLQCNAKHLARMGAILASGGKLPETGKRVLDRLHVQHALSIMLTCGLYSGAGTWAVQVGVPAKSGVDGGLMVAVPGRFGLGIYSPRLDEHGNSVRGVKVCSMLDDMIDIHCILPMEDPNA